LGKGKDRYFSTTVNDDTYIVTLFYTDVHLYRNREVCKFFSHDSRSQATTTYKSIRDTLCMIS
jgi:hypothetical protein